MIEGETELKPDKTGVRINLFSVVLVWALVVAPSILHSPIGMLDDPYTMVVSRELIHDWRALEPFLEVGRFQPFFLLPKALIFSIVGFEPAGYYGFQAILGLASALLVFLLVLRFTGSPVAAMLAGSFFLTGSPVYESFYTLGKAEIQAFLLLLAGVWLVYDSVGSLSVRSPLRDGLAFFLITICAVFTKETLMMMPALPLGGWLATRLFRDDATDRVAARWLVLAGASIGAVALARVVYYYLLPANASTAYTAVAFSLAVVKANLGYYFTQQPDVLLFGFAALGLVAYWGALICHSSCRPLRVHYCLVVAMLLAGWAYLTGMLFWKVGGSYYVYIPCALFQVVSIVAGLFIYQAHRSQPFPKLVYGLVVVMVIALKLYTLAYGYYVAASQRENDSMYYEAVREYLGVAKPGERLLFLQWNYYDEPPIQTRILIQQLYRQENEVFGIKTIYAGQDPSRTQLQLSLGGLVDSEVLWPRKGDYILVQTGYKPAHWHVRGVAPYSDSKTGIDLTEMPLKAENSMSHSVAYFTARFQFRFEKTYRGYKLYQYREPRIHWNGLYSDGWMGRTATAQVGQLQQKPILELEVAVPEPVLPQRLTISLGDKVMDIRTFQQAGTHTVVLDTRGYVQGGDSVQLRFEALNFFVPKQLNTSDDNRELGLRIKLRK